MASIYRATHPSGKISQGWSLKCYTCGNGGRGRWRLRYPDGRAIRDRRDALREKAEHERQCRPSGEAPQTVSRLLTEYLQATRDRRSPRAQKDDQFKAARLSTLIGARPVRELNPGLIEGCLRRLQDEYPKVGLARRDKYLVFLRSVARWAVEIKGYCYQDFTRPLARLSKSGSRVYLPAARWEELLRLAKPSKYYAGVLMVLHTGIRSAELLRLEVGDLDLTKHILTIRAEVSKTGTARYLGLTDRLVETLRGCLPATGRAFPYYGPRFQRQVGAWLRTMGLSGKPLGLYTLRHAFGTEAVKHFSPFAVQQMMGHASIQTTQRYVHVDQVPVAPAQMNALSGTDNGHTA